MSRGVTRRSMLAVFILFSECAMSAGSPPIGCTMPTEFSAGVVPMAKHRLGRGERPCVAGSILCYHCQCRVECQKGYIPVGSYAALRDSTTKYTCLYEGGNVMATGPNQSEPALTGLVAPPLSCFPITDRDCSLPTAFDQEVSIRNAEGYTETNALSLRSECDYTTGRLLNDSEVPCTVGCEPNGVIPFGESCEIQCKPGTC